jgi:hypothetical protein
MVTARTSTLTTVAATAQGRRSCRAPSACSVVASTGSTLAERSILQP